MTEDGLAAAEATDRSLREQISDLVRARARAQSEARRLGDRTAAGGDESLASIRERYERQAVELGDEIDGLRADLRSHEVELERLRAERAGA